MDMSSRTYHQKPDGCQDMVTGPCHLVLMCLHLGLGTAISMSALLHFFTSSTARPIVPLGPLDHLQYPADSADNVQFSHFPT